MPSAHTGSGGGNSRGALTADGLPSAPTSSGSSRGILTADGLPYTYTGSAHAIAVSNSTGSGNEREVYWPQDAPAVTSSTICETWSSGQGIAQNGVAFRISSDGSSGVVLERNVWAYGYWSFVALKFAHGSFTELNSVNLGAYLGTDKGHDIWPLRICAHIGNAGVLSFAVAKGSDPMPTHLGAGLQGGTFHLANDGLPAAGATGAYVAHLPPGTSVTVDHITIGKDLSVPTGG